MKLLSLLLPEVVEEWKALIPISLFLIEPFWWIAKIGLIKAIALGTMR